MPSSDAPKQQTKSKLDDQTLERLFNAIWICKIGNFNEHEAIAYINSGELGYHKATKQDIDAKKLRPITIERATYYKYKKELESPEYQTQEIFKIVREEYLAKIIARFKLFESLESKSMKALESESDPHKQQLIINGIFRNSPYVTSLMDIIKQLVERNKMPFPKNEEVQKILEKEKVAHKT